MSSTTQAKAGRHVHSWRLEEDRPAEVHPGNAWCCGLLQATLAKEATVFGSLTLSIKHQSANFHIHRHQAS